jgi:hypothetical protein|tara:strand:- start:647 stop:859 length:213 start_codon:yes stop_codon:yes gene_type:complete
LISGAGLSSGELDRLRLTRFDLGGAARAALHSAQFLFTLPCGQGLHFTQLFFSLPWGQGLHAAQFFFSFP